MFGVFVGLHITLYTFISSCGSIYFDVAVLVLLYEVNIEWKVFCMIIIIKYLYSYTHKNIKYLNAVYIDLH